MFIEKLMKTLWCAGLALSLAACASQKEIRVVGAQPEAAPAASAPMAQATPAGKAGAAIARKDERPANCRGATGSLGLSFSPTYVVAFNDNLSTYDIRYCRDTTARRPHGVNPHTVPPVGLQPDPDQRMDVFVQKWTNPADPSDPCIQWSSGGSTTYYCW
jgi:hypothetical protein